MPPFSIDIPIHSRHLHIPVRSGNPRIVFQIFANGQMVREFVIELADSGMVDWWAFYDMSAFQGQCVTLSAVDDIPAAQAGWLAGAIGQSDGILAGDDLYHEKNRPQFHFTPRRGWNNDPNGMVFYRGEWHLFFQHNPFGTRWGNMHWGHAVSPDLVHWTELPEALYQRSLQDMAFSGGGLVDSANSAGWKRGEEDPLVVAFTSTGRGECLAYSLDCGRTLMEHPGNPIIAHQGRDPKIIWYEPGQHWVLIVFEDPLSPGVGRGSHGDSPSFGYAIYTSNDLQSWQRRSFLPGWYECPELFEAPVEGQFGVSKWVIYGCLINQFTSAYLVGSFDGQTFTPEMDPALAHFGPAFYAGQVFSQAPGHRQIMIGWLKGASYPGMPFSQGMTVPLELSLRHDPTSKVPYHLCFQPVVELAKLRQAPSFTLEHSSLEQANVLLSSLESVELLDIHLEIEATGPFNFWIGEVLLAWDPDQDQVSFAGKSAPILPEDGRLSLRILVDRSVCEVFVNRGWAAFAAMTLFSEGRPLRLEGKAQYYNMRVYPMASVWA